MCTFVRARSCMSCVCVMEISLCIAYMPYFVPTLPTAYSLLSPSFAVYRAFTDQWEIQLAKDAVRRRSSTDKRRELPRPSLAVAFISAFGGPFFAAGALKLVHDSLLFVGPYLLNRLIKFLGDPSLPRSHGLWLVRCV